ncbi:hypothetical protein A3H16_02125 [Candidatus Kaiserbacteria bacterium RIFCSPLOWO2_12_FULL_53_8]|uniref:DUF1761 domain-containing protein n=2 Tax=Candidatus Kaiseribacteriota TaxID=1752734 RepID=A0A1F6CWK9_9BACT|nr:MAG: hypothetical protein A2851_03840 [Candidatus Kaiserbacteria bacterium RIFCSPHIGHO2_01_FULL_53_29]OGG92296.1 MAG: hypothetical protein A3H16_02125 [Candidatus Kaiserbacteria bacterium RIFCSPLOWO2_12_FULL_53_8]
MVEVTFWPILAAGTASVLIGWVWYHPKVFGSVWMRLNNVTPEQVERGKKRMPLYAFVALLASMLVAWVMNYVGIAFGIYDWVGAVFELALWSWLGFVVPTLLGQVLWEQKPIKLYLINVLYWLVSFVVMALILVVGSQALGGMGSYDMQIDAGEYYME